MGQPLEYEADHRGVDHLVVGALNLGKGAPVFTAKQAASLRLVMVRTSGDTAMSIIVTASTITSLDMTTSRDIVKRSYMCIDVMSCRQSGQRCSALRLSLGALASPRLPT